MYRAAVQLLITVVGRIRLPSKLCKDEPADSLTLSDHTAVGQRGAKRFFSLSLSLPSLSLSLPPPLSLSLSLSLPPSPSQYISRMAPWSEPSSSSRLALSRAIDDSTPEKQTQTVLSPPEHTSDTNIRSRQTRNIETETR